MTLRKLLPLAVMCVLACDTPEKVEALQARVDELDGKLKAAEDKAKAHDKVAERVTELEKRVATDEADASASREAQKADGARLDALRLELDELKIQLAKLIEASTKPPETGGSTPAKIEKVGIPACDEYLEKYSRCIEDKMPESVRDASMDAVVQTAEAWKQAAATPAGREALGEACKAARDAAKKALESLGCTF